jgi:hypothetical protein
VNKPAHDETPCPLKKNVKGYCLGVASIVGMSLMLLSYDHGRLARDETPYSLWEKFMTYICFYIFSFLIIQIFLGSIKGGSSTP